jgi:AGZA family xanthine/uracil permease-like MFS transporter
MVNGLGTIAAACFGSPFPTSIYIGHPAWKKLGARAGYSVLNGVAVTLICLTGTMAALTWLIPAEAGVAIILWIGIIIAAQAFEVTPSRHHVAVVVGLFPGIAAWVMLIVKTALAAVPGPAVLSPALIRSAHAAGAYLGGGFALEQGFLYSAMIWSATVVCLVDRQWRRAAAWCGIGGVLSLAGLMHSYLLAGRDTALDLPLLSWLNGQWKPGHALFPAGAVALGYGLASVLFLLTPYLTIPRSDNEVA